MSIQNLFLSDPETVLAKPKKSRSGSVKKKEIKISTFDCNHCGLCNNCNSPKIKRFGKGQKGILIIGLCPGRTEDKTGVPLTGASGEFLRKYCNLVGIDLDNDCIRTNIVQCYPGRGKDGKDIAPTDEQIRCCRNNIIRDIEETKPKMIICLGTESISSILESESIPAPNVTKLHGKVFPYHKLGCWVASIHHPSFYLHHKKDNNGVNDELIFAYDLANIIAMSDYQLPKPFNTEGNIYLSNPDEIVEKLNYFTKNKKPTAFDYETTCISPYNPEARLLYVSLSDTQNIGYCIPIDVKVNGVFLFDEYNRNRIKEALKYFLISDCPKVIQNYAMEELWSQRILGVGINNFIHDTMVSNHVIYNKTGTSNLDFMSFELTGHEYKSIIDVKHIEDSDPVNVKNYSSWDSRYTIALYYVQKKILNLDKKLSDFNSLLTKAVPVLTNMKRRGIPIDLKVIDELYDEFKDKMDACLNEISKNQQIQLFEKNTGEKFNSEAPTQWCKILYEYYEVPPFYTAKNNYTADEKALKAIQSATDNIELKKLLDETLNYRMFSGVLKKCDEYRRVVCNDGRIRPSFNLHTVKTYRSSATEPNSQNVYKHDEECKPFRRCFVPEPGQILLDADFKNNEVRGIAMTSGDKELIRQVIDGVDFHKKYAARIFQKHIDKVTSDERYRAKNLFVFPSFYGSKPNAMSKNLGISRDHLTIVQNELWDEFAGVRDWQIRLVQFYNQNGYIEGLSGYKVYGPLSIYDIYNYPIQGTSFHLFLSFLIDFDNHLVKNGFKSAIINEVHDAAILTADPDEIPEIIRIGNQLVAKQRYDWQVVPMAVDWEIGENWYKMQKIAA